MFVYEMGKDEKNLSKRSKIDQLGLDEEEWEQVD